MSKLDIQLENDEYRSLVLLWLESQESFDPQVHFWRTSPKPPTSATTLSKTKLSCQVPDLSVGATTIGHWG